MTDIVRTTVEENDANIVKSQVMNVLDDNLIRHQVRGLEQPAPEPPVLETLNVTENGTYTPEEGVDGFDEVNVNVELPGDDAYDLKSATPGAVVSFTDGLDLPLNELVVDIDAPDGVSACNIANVSDTDKTEYFKGLLNGTYGFVDLGSLTWTKSVSPQRFEYNTTINNIKAPSNNDTLMKGIVNGYIIVTANTSTQNVALSVNSTGYLRIYDASKYSLSPEDFKTAMNGVYFIYELNTPTTPTIIPTEFNTLLTAFDLNGWLYKIDFLDGSTPVSISNGSLDIINGVLTDNDTSDTYQLTPLAVRSLEGANNIFADTGDITECEYFYEVTVAGDDLICQIKVVDVEGTPTIVDVKRDFALTGNNAITITDGNIDFGSDENCYLNCQVTQMNLVPYVIESDIVSCAFETDTENNKMRGIFTFGKNKSTLWGLFFNTIATTDAGKGTLTFRPQLNQTEDSRLIAPSEFEDKTLKLYCNCGLDSNNNIIYDKNNALIYLGDELLINADFSNYAGENWDQMCSMGWSSYNWGCPGLVISEYRVKELSKLM